MGLAKFLLFGLSFASNFIIIGFIPYDLLKGFVATYATTSLIAGICIVLAFSSTKITSLVHIWAPTIAVLLFLIGWQLPEMGVWIAYSCMLLMSDYITSQSGSIRLPIIYRCCMLISAALFIFCSDAFVQLILLRGSICLIFMSIVLICYKKLKLLKMKTPLLVIVISNVSYWGVLLSLTILIPNQALRLWYMGSQIGLGVLLKRFDFQIRGDTDSNRIVDTGVVIFVTAIPIFLAIFWFNVWALLLYVASAFVISRLKYFIK
jgi:hypothetical protein